MRSATPLTRLDHDTMLRAPAVGWRIPAIAAVTLALSYAATAAAQGAPCTSIDDDAERLACYDRALRPAPQPTPSPAATSARPPATPETRAAAPERRHERAVRESTAPAAPVAGRGRGDDDEEVVPMVVVGLRALPGRETTFTAKDGSAWVQTDSQRLVNLPEAPFDAELKRGSMGSYFLVPKAGGRAIRVRPVTSAR